ncbi:MAG: cobalamin biosynthesis protein (CbiG) [Cenarchaeum symbiont of Oopsacas minuta]|nr:cobalamin biosynthesis protein (CbiG) [Cenarchaeum symbiont of Oopsacas minuta]
MNNVAIVTITRNGLKLGKKLINKFPTWTLFAPAKFSDNDSHVTWFEEAVSIKMGEMFSKYDALVCIFSLGAVIRLVAPHLVDKKTDPAVIVIDDAATHVISVLSGHIGGANELSKVLADILGAVPVITTAADVNCTIAVDLVGRDLGWIIDDDSKVTTVSACMVNGESIGLLQQAGSKDWWKGVLPKNVTVYDTQDDLESANPKAALFITDKTTFLGIENTVVYRPPSLVLGVGLHMDTTVQTISRGIDETLEKFGLSLKSVSKIASIKKPVNVKGLEKYCKEHNLPIEYVDRTKLATIPAPNPSETVKALEGTSSVSEAAALLVSRGKLVVEKQKFPPDLTVAVARVED